MKLRKDYKQIEQMIKSLLLNSLTTKEYNAEVAAKAILNMLSDEGLLKSNDKPRNKAA